MNHFSDNRIINAAFKGATERGLEGEPRIAAVFAESNRSKALARALILEAIRNKEGEWVRSNNAAIRRQESIKPSIVLVPSKAMGAYKQRLKTRAATNKLLWLDHTLPLPGRPKLRDATFAQATQAATLMDTSAASHAVQAAWFRAIGRAGKPNQVVGKVLDEATVARMRSTAEQKKAA